MFIFIQANITPTLWPFLDVETNLFRWIIVSHLHSLFWMTNNILKEITWYVTFKAWACSLLSYFMLIWTAWSCLSTKITTAVEITSLNILNLCSLSKCHLKHESIWKESRRTWGANGSLFSMEIIFFWEFHFGTWHDNSKLTCSALLF